MTGEEKRSRIDSLTAACPGGQGRALAVIGRHVGEKPVDEGVHFGDVLGRGGAVLLRPALGLAFAIVAGGTVICEAGGVEIDGMDGHEGSVHGVDQGGAVFWVNFG